MCAKLSIANYCRYWERNARTVYQRHLLATFLTTSIWLCAEKMCVNEWFGYDGSLYTQFCVTNFLLSEGITDTQQIQHHSQPSNAVFEAGPRRRAI